MFEKQADMTGKLIVITGLDGTGTSSLADRLSVMDPCGVAFRTPGEVFSRARSEIDEIVRDESQAAHYLFYLAAVVHASVELKEKLKHHNVYCTRYLIDTVVSHRVNGIPAELEYETALYAIPRPTMTLFIEVGEEERQRRLDSRGRSHLDRLLDDGSYRSRFLREFNRFDGEFERIDNTEGDINATALKAAELMPWIPQYHHV
jgi:thymidylate kinase